MDVWDFVSGGIGAIAGVGTTIFATKKQESRSDFTELVDKWKGIYDEVREQERKCAEELKSVRSELVKLQNEMVEVKYQINGRK